MYMGNLTKNTMRFALLKGLRSRGHDKGYEVRKSAP